MLIHLENTKIKVNILENSSTSLIYYTYIHTYTYTNVRLYIHKYNTERYSYSLFSENLFRTIKLFRNMHIEKNNSECLVQSNQNRIVFTIFRLICNQTEFNLVLNHSENGKYNPILFRFPEMLNSIPLH